MPSGLDLDGHLDLATGKGVANDEHCRSTIGFTRVNNATF
jgi:hypothetical protein